MGARGLAIRDDLEAAALRRFAQTEPDRRAALRALAIAQALEGASRAEAASVVGRERQSLRDAVVRYNAEGLAGLHDRPRPRRREKLDKARQEDLRAWVLRGPDPDVDGLSSYRLLDIAAHIEACWGVCYTLSALARLLRRMGLSWQKARLAHPKGSAEARELYKKPRRRAGGRRCRASWQADPGLVRR
ncbi:MAG: winged helix-turn-helix domain-containing protein [Acetobacteraceae bacterium]|nr:winged helix-turn-helix domain-containing protein [Acetobacteraceae bacterium]